MSSKIAEDFIYSINLQLFTGNGLSQMFSIEQDTAGQVKF